MRQRSRHGSANSVTVGINPRCRCAHSQRPPSATSSGFRYRYLPVSGPVDHAMKIAMRAGESGSEQGGRRVLLSSDKGFQFFDRLRRARHSLSHRTNADVNSIWHVRPVENRAVRKIQRTGIAARHCRTLTTAIAAPSGTFKRHTVSNLAAGIEGRRTAASSTSRPCARCSGCISDPRYV